MNAHLSPLASLFVLAVAITVIVWAFARILGLGKNSPDATPPDAAPAPSPGAGGVHPRCGTFGHAYTDWAKTQTHWVCVTCGDQVARLDEQPKPHESANRVTVHQVTVTPEHAWRLFRPTSQEEFEQAVAEALAIANGEPPIPAEKWDACRTSELGDAWCPDCRQRRTGGRDLCAICEAEVLNSIEESA